MSEFGLKAVIDATSAERGERELVKSFDRIKKAAEEAAKAVDRVSGTGRSVTQRGLAAAGGGSRARAGTTAVDRVAAQESRQRIANERALQSALTRRENIEQRISRQLGESATLTNQARAATEAYASAIQRYGAGSLQAVRAQGQFQREMTRVSSEIARTNGMLPTLNRGFGSVSNTIRDAARNTAVYLGPLNAVTGRISALASVVGSVGPVAAATTVSIGGLIYGLRNGIRAAEEFEQMGLRTEAIIRATGGAAGFTATQIRGFAQEIADSTNASVAGVERAAGIMMSFRRVYGDTFREALELAQDLAAVGFGNLETNARMLARALEDPEQGLSNLRRMGVIFSQSQRELIFTLAETGREAEAQRIILDRLQQQVGGAGRGEAAGLTGATGSLGQAWQNLLSTIGNAGPLREAESAIRGITSAIQALDASLQELPLSDQRSAIQDRLDTIRERAGSQWGSGALGDQYSAERDQLFEQLRMLEERERREHAALRYAEQKSQWAQEELDREREQERLAKEREEREKRLNALDLERRQLRARLEFQDPNSRDAMRAARLIEYEDRHGAEAAREAAPELKRIDELEEQIERRREAAATSSAQREARAALLADLDSEIEKRRLLIEMGGVESPAYRDAVTVMDVRREHGDSAADAVEDRLAYQRGLDRQIQGMQGVDPTAGIRSDTLRAQGFDAEALAIDRASEAQRRYNELVREGVEADHARSLVDQWHQVVSASDQAAQNAALFEETWGTAADAAANAMTQFATGSMSAMDALRSVVEQVAADMVRELFRVLIMQILTGTIGSGFGGGTATGGPTVLFPQGGGTGGDIFSGIYHRGGRVGLDPVPMRRTPVELFQHAPRYHQGGIAGLKPNEVPAILERGERVIPNGAGAGGSVTIAPNISIRVEGGSQGPQADRELAERIGKEVDAAVNAAVDERLVRQRRPGGLLNPVYG